jgi:putative peptidoglycan lipid II flippase
VENNLNSNNSLAKASTLMAAGTIFSRITGLIRNLLLVALLGTTLLGDTYNVANTMPNILYNLLVGGALTAVFVPQIVRSLRDSDGGNAFISRLFTATVLFLLTLTTLGILLAPQIVNIYAPKFNGLPEFDVTVLFMRYCLPQIFFLGLFALLGQIANAKGKFGPMMWAPVINNLIVIALFGWYLQNHDQLSIGNITTHDIYWLGAGTTVGYLAQAVILLPVVYRSGVKLAFKFDLKNAQLFNSIKLAGWSFLYALISQLSYLVTIIIATSAAVKSASNGLLTGVGYTPYSNAYLILILPHSIITVSVMTALLPKLANLVIDKKLPEVKAELSNAIKIVGVFIVPAAMIFLFFGPLVARTLYFGISTDDANYLGYTLAGFALGLIPVSINLILLRGLNAFENLKSQVIGNLIMNLISVGLSIAAAILIEPKWVVVAMAVIFTIHYFIGVGISFYLIRKHQINLAIPAIALHYFKLLMLFSVAIIPLFLIQSSLPGGNLIQLILVMVISTTLYLALGFIFKIKEIKSAVELLSRSVR